jgi:hypothetical protein
MKRFDFVIGTAWSDGSPKDSWEIGFYVGPKRNDPEFHLIMDWEGNINFPEGYRRIEKITAERAFFIQHYKSQIMKSDKNIYHYFSFRMSFKEKLEQIFKGKGL